MIQEALYMYGTEHFNQRCSEVTSHQGKCYFDTSMLGPCFKSPFGFNKNKPCVYFRLAKIFNFIPLGESKNQQFIPIHCWVDNMNNYPFKIYPGGGFLRDALPFNGKNLPPLVAVQIERNKSTNLILKCVMKADDVPVSKSFLPDEAYGVIEFEIHPEEDFNCN
ncbi:hypothetical protein HZS_4533 [Henneguya salminicola]|nr:hypothetical protein HZS_4533 [Henneguya salminicola]